MIVSVPELVTYMSGVNFNASQTDAATQVLNGVQRSLERYLNRFLEPTLVQERVQAGWDGSVRFSYTPVVKFISMIDPAGFSLPVNGWQQAPTVPAMDDDEWEEWSDEFGATRQVDLIPGTFYGWLPQEFNGTLIGAPKVWYALKYISVLILPNQDDLKLDILRVAAREMTRNHDDSVSLKDGIMGDDTNPMIEGITGLGWTDDELAKYGRYRRRVIV